MNMLKYIPEYEALTGCKMHRYVIEFVEQLDAIGKTFERKGREDAGQGLPAACDESFQAWGKKVFDDDQELAESMSEIMKMYYMDGYEGEAE